MIRFLVREVVLGARGIGSGSAEPSLGTDRGENPTLPPPGGSQIQVKKSPANLPAPCSQGGYSSAGSRMAPTHSHRSAPPRRVPGGGENRCAAPSLPKPSGPSESSGEGAQHGPQR